MSDNRAMAGAGEAARAQDLAELPIDVVEAMYSPDFVELATLTTDGLPLVLPMSFTLDVAGNCVRFSSPVGAARLAHLARDPRCAVSFSRVTVEYSPILLQGVAALGEVAEGVRRGPARRFTVSPTAVFALDEPPRSWRLAGSPTVAAVPAPATGVGSSDRRASAATAVTTEDLAALAGFATTVVGLRDTRGWPVSLPVEPERDKDRFVARLPALDGLSLEGGVASLLGHTWTKDGPRFLVLTGRATIDGATLHFTPRRARRRG